MKRIKFLAIIIALLVSLLGVLTAEAAPPQSKIPTFSITSVIEDESVTIKTYNFPANDHFKVTMGEMGTKGKQGIYVGEFNTGDGGTFSKTFQIPSALEGEYQISIRTYSTTGSGYYAYNWFYNNTSSKPGGGTKPGKGGYTGIPTFKILEVERNKTVTIKTHNLPKNDRFSVLMGPMGSQGKNGIKVDTVNSGDGGSVVWTFDIPSQLKGSYQIAIRLQSVTGSGYYAYNWFYNNTTGQVPSDGNGEPDDGYSGVPTFSITDVKRNVSVSIKTKNLPENEDFKVLMGPMGTKGVNGYKVDVIDSGDGGSKNYTFDIPPQLMNYFQISIRLQSVSGSGLYAYNWFYNNSTY